jgi:hypothetical protein
MSAAVRLTCCAAAVLLLAAALPAADPPHPVMRWVKRHPLPEAARPSPRMGYETSLAYDPASRLVIRWGGHNQGGGGEQNSELWTYDLARDVWTHMQPNDAPPGVCCAQQNVFDPVGGRFIRFPAFSGSHGWQSFREIHLKNTSVWTYHQPTNTWMNMRPCPEPRLHGLHGAAWLPRQEVSLIHGGEGAGYGTLIYDPHTNTWAEAAPASDEPATRESQPGFAYDATRGLFVRFGAQFTTDTRTWLFDLASRKWRVLPTDGHPPADAKEAAPVLEADTRSGVVLCSIRNRAGEKHETWVLELEGSPPERGRWRRLDLAEEIGPETGSRNRVLIYIEEQNLFLMENSIGKPREQQVWTLRYAEAAPPPAPVPMSVVTEKSAAVLAWQPPAGAPAAASWTVERAEGTRPWEAEFKPVATGVMAATWRDDGLPRGFAGIYRALPVYADGSQGPPSRLGRTQPAVVAPVRASALGPKEIEVTWTKPAAADIAGVYVERAHVRVWSVQQLTRVAQRYRPASERAVGAVRSIGAFVRLTPEPVAGDRFTDAGADLAAAPAQDIDKPIQEYSFHKDQLAGGKPYPWAVYAYRVVAVNRLGAEGGPSPLAFTFPAAVEHVFSKEEGDAACRLKWAASPQAGVRGYLVYRHDARYDKDAISLLTPRPLTATEFVDPEAGKDTRRYEVVAVDALGQEGEPSQPVWSRREWARYYTPYVGEWHQ